MTTAPAHFDSPDTPRSLSSDGLSPPRQSADDPIPSSPPLATPASTTGSYFGTMFTGIIRRFSTEDSQLGSQIDSFFMGPPTGQQQSQEASSSATSQDDGVNGVFQPPIKRTVSPFRPPPLDPLVLHTHGDGSAALLTHGIAEEIRTMIPERLRITEDWKIVYSLEHDGASLSTLYQKCREFEGRRVGFVLVVKDQDGSVSSPSQPSTPEDNLTANHNDRHSAPTCQITRIQRRATSAMANASSGGHLYSPRSPLPPQPTQPSSLATHNSPLPHAAQRRVTTTFQ